HNGGRAARGRTVDPDPVLCRPVFLGGARAGAGRRAATDSPEQADRRAAGRRHPSCGERPRDAAKRRGVWRTYPRRGWRGGGGGGVPAASSRGCALNGVVPTGTPSPLLTRMI